MSARSVFLLCGMGIIGMTAVLGCTPMRSSPAASALKYKLHDRPGIMPRVLEPVLRVCVIAYGQTRESALTERAGWAPSSPSDTRPGASVKSTPVDLDAARDQVHKAILAWLDPLRSFVKAPIVSEILLLGKEDGCTIDGLSHPVDVEYVFFDTKGRAVVDFSSSSPPRSTIYANDSFPVVLHETGHVLGLADTYQENGRFCMIGQPRSVMCPMPITTSADGYPSMLVADDAAGVRAAFCRSHPDQDACRGQIKAGDDFQAFAAQTGGATQTRRAMRLGASVTDGKVVYGGQTKPCALVSKVEVDGAAHKMNIKRGACILSAEDRTIQKAADLIQAIRESRSSVLTLFLCYLGACETVSVNLHVEGGSREIVVGDDVMTVVATRLTDRSRGVTAVPRGIAFRVEKKEKDWVFVSWHLTPWQGWISLNDVELITIQDDVPGEALPGARH